MTALHLRSTVRSLFPPLSVPFLIIFSSQSCFVVELPSTFFLWKGKQTDAESIAAAQRIVRQFQKYEVAPETVKEMSEGEESEEFWCALGGKNLTGERVPPVYVHPPLPFNADQARDFTAVRGDVPASAPPTVSNSLDEPPKETERKKEKRDSKREKKETRDKKEKKDKDKKKDKKEKKKKKKERTGSEDNNGESSDKR